MSDCEQLDLNRFAMDLEEIARRHSPQAVRLWRDMMRDVNGPGLWLTMLLTDLWRKASFAAIAQAYPDASENERKIKFVELAYGKELADGFGEWLRAREATAG